MTLAKLNLDKKIKLKIKTKFKSIEDKFKYTQQKRQATRR